MKRGDRLNMCWALKSNLADLKSIHWFNHKFGFYYSIRFFLLFFVSHFFDAEYIFGRIKTKAPFSIDALLKIYEHSLIIPSELCCKFNSEITDTYTLRNYMVQNRDWCENLWAVKVIWMFNGHGANFESHVTIIDRREIVDLQKALAQFSSNISYFVPE